MRALIKFAAGRIPASVSAIVKGELAVVEFAFSSLSLVYGIKMPMKKMVPNIVRDRIISSLPRQRTNVEDKDTPENLVDCSWYRFLRIGGLSSSDTDPTRVR